MADEGMIDLKIRRVPEQTRHILRVFPQTTIDELCQLIERNSTTSENHDASEFGLFFNDQQQASRSFWLEPSRTLNFYNIKAQDELEFKNRFRPLKIRLLDGTVKTILVDDSLLIGQLMVYICTKFGIANYDEYSLVFDLENCGKTSTLRRDRSLQRVDKKMEELKKKCHTDDDVLWLDQTKTLRQQEIDEQSTVVLRRKYFFSDTNIDQRDPVQLNLLYVQCRNGIIDGTHPVTLDEAVEFAGLQCQIEFGDFQEVKHKSDIFDLREFLPKEYVKTKNIDKRISTEHKKHVSLTEADGKVKYTQRCRSLRTYGVTFFLVKEKSSGKNKLVPRLLGINKESIVRVDERTKDFIQIWPLTHVKRWTASPNTFTLDFGDYASAFYSVQTNEGQQISQLIAGYIDIILKKRKDPDVDDRTTTVDEEAMMIEDIIAPGKATIIQPNRPSFGFAQQENVQSTAPIRGTLSDTLHQTENRTNNEVNVNFKSTSVLIGSLINARNQLRSMQDQFEKNQFKHVHSDVQQRNSRPSIDVSQQLLTGQISAINACTAQIILLTSDVHQNSDDIQSSLAAAVSMMTSNLNEFSKGILCNVHWLSDAAHLIDQTSRLSTVVEDLINYIETLAKNKVDAVNKQNVLLIATRLGEISQDLVRRLTDDFDCSIEYQDQLLALAKSVANSTAVYVLRAKDIASHIHEQSIINEIISSATYCALATSQLVACTKVVVPTISSPLCQEPLIESARNVTRSIESVLDTCLPPRSNDQFYSELINASRTVRHALNEFLLHIKLITDRTAAHSDRLFENCRPTTLIDRRIPLNEQLTKVIEEEDAVDEEFNLTPDQSIDRIFSASDRLFSSMGDANEMVQQAKILAQATAELVSTLRRQAESSDDDGQQQKKLLAAAKLLADATGKMVEAAKICAGKPNDHQIQNQLKRSVEELRSATHLAMNHQNQRKIFQRIEQCAKHSASCATQCIAATSACTLIQGDDPSPQNLVQQCKVVADFIPKLVQAIRMCMIQPDSWPQQISLLYTCDDFIEPAEALVKYSQLVLRIIENPSEALHLNQSSKQLYRAASDLRSCLDRGEELCNTMVVDVDSMIQSIELFERELRQMKSTSTQLNIRANDRATTFEQINNHLQEFFQTIYRTQRIDERSYESLVRSFIRKLRFWIRIIRQRMNQCQNDEQRRSIIEDGHHFIRCINELFIQIKQISTNPIDEVNMKKFVSLRENLFVASYRSLDIEPTQKCFEQAMKQMSEYMYQLSGPFDRNRSNSSSPSFNSESLNRAADQLTRATTDLVHSTQRGIFNDLAQDSTRFSRAFGDFLHQSLDYVHQQDEEERRSHLLVSLKNAHTTSNQFLERAKSVSIEPENHHKQQLADAARAVTETIQNVINTCLVTTPIGRVQCDHIIEDMESAKVLLDQSHIRPCSNATYYEALDQVVENSKRLGEAMTHIASASKNINHSLYQQAIRDGSRAVCLLVEAAAQASYLIVIGQPPSSGTFIDQTVFNRSVIAIRKACADLNNTSIDRNDILTLATTIAKNTSALCNLSRDSSSHTVNPLIRRRFVQSAKDVANATANLVRSIKVLDSSYSDENRQICIDTSRPLLESVQELDIFIKSKDVSRCFQTTDSSIQEPILMATRNVVDGVCHIVECSKVLIVNSKDASLWQQLATHTKQVSESIKRLATLVKDMIPGQDECQRSIEQLRKTFQQIDYTILHVQTLNSKDLSIDFCRQEIAANCRCLLELIDPLSQASKYHCERLAMNVSQWVIHIDSTIHHTIDLVSCLDNMRERLDMIEQSKSMVERSLQIILSSKESGGNHKQIQWHRTLDQQCQQFRQFIVKFLENFERTSMPSSYSIDHLRHWLSIFDQPIDRHHGHHLSDHQKDLISVLQDLKQTVEEINPTNYGQAPHIVHYQRLIQLTHQAMATDIDVDFAETIKHAVIELGSTIIQLTQTFNQSTSSDWQSRTEKVVEKIAHLLLMFENHSTDTVDGIIADLNATMIFAKNNVRMEKIQSQTFTHHREAILKTAKDLVEDTKALVAAATSSQEQITSTGQAAVKTMTKLVDVVKSGATSLEGQIQLMLINSVKDVALALNNLINVTKIASGKSIDHPEMKRLKECAKIMVTNVTCLLRTVKSIEEKTQQGRNILEMTIHSIEQQLDQWYQIDTSNQIFTPEDLIRVSKQITVATSKTVLAGQSGRSEDLIQAADLGRQGITDLLTICKFVRHHMIDRTFQERFINDGRSCAKSYQEFLKTIYQFIEQPSNNIKQDFVQHSRNIAQAIQELGHCDEQWKNISNEQEDRSTVAEDQLLQAAQSIESAARKLSVLKPRRTIQDLDDNLNFDEKILDAAKIIMSATSTLISAATSAQRELVQQGKLSSNSISMDDGQWSEGLISAARYVTSACHVLCEAANGFLQSVDSEEKLISCARQVNSTTAALLVACKVKADFLSPSMTRLQAAGQNVKRATDTFVRAVKETVDTNREEKPIEVATRLVSGIAQEIKCKEIILTKERELDEARHQLKAIRLAKYGHPESESNDST